MDSFALGQSYPSRSPRTINEYSQVTTNAYGFKNVDIPCQFHTDEQLSNYCTEGKCYQPLCSQCIEDHLILHKKHGYSDLGIKSMKGTRNNCIVKLGRIIDELLKRLDQFQAPAAPQQQLQTLQIKLQAVKNEIHQVIQVEFSRIRQSLRARLAQSTNLFKQMGQIHFKLQGIIQQLRQTHVTLIDGGKRGGTAIPDCIRRTLSLDVEGLLSTFQNQALTYEARRKKTAFDVIFQKDLFRNFLAESVKVITPHGLNTSSVTYASKLTPRVKNNRTQQQDFSALLPEQLIPRGNISFLHFFETGSNRLHLIEVQNRSKGVSQIVQINEFIVPAFHASLISLTGQFIFLSGGIVQLNNGGKSPMFVRYSVKTGTNKKDFARVRARSSHSLCQDANGDVYILGGYGITQPKGGDTPFQTTVQRVNERNGKVELETASNWGGSNIAALCRNFILKACDEGVQLYNPQFKQWIIADVINRPLSEYLFFKNAGYANLNESQLLVFGGYDSQSAATDICLGWKVVIEGVRAVKVVITKLNCRLPLAQGFDSCGAMLDERGLFVLQNIQDDEGGCLQNQKKLLRFDLRNGSGDWKELQIISQEEQ